MTADEEHYRKLERMYALAPTNRYFAPRLVVGDGRAELTIPLRPDFHHGAGAVHGAVYFKALDDSAFFAANSRVTDVFVLTVSYTVYLTRPVVDGEMIATGRVVSETKQLLIAESEVRDSQGRQIARGSGTFMRSRIALSPDIGYA